MSSKAVARAQQRKNRADEKELRKLVKAVAKRSGWKACSWAAFKTHGDWFLSLTVFVNVTDGSTHSEITVKPMGLDRMFWEIAGLQENERAPLSLRAVGAWVCNPPSWAALDFKLDGDRLQPLAEGIVDWANKTIIETEADWSIDALLELSRTHHIRHGSPIATEICLLLMKGDFQGARELCDLDDSRGVHRGGGYTTHYVSGPITFVQQTRNWLDHRTDGLSRD